MLPHADMRNAVAIVGADDKANRIRQFSLTLEMTITNLLERTKNTKEVGGAEAHAQHDVVSSSIPRLPR